MPSSIAEVNARVKFDLLNFATFNARVTSQIVSQNCWHLLHGQLYGSTATTANNSCLFNSILSKSTPTAPRQCCNILSTLSIGMINEGAGGLTCQQRVKYQIFHTVALFPLYQFLSRMRGTDVATVGQVQLHYSSAVLILDETQSQLASQLELGKRLRRKLMTVTFSIIHYYHDYC